MVNSSIAINSSLSSKRSSSGNNTSSFNISVEGMYTAVLEYLSYSGEFDWLVLSANNGQTVIVGNGTGLDQYSYNKVCPETRSIDLSGATVITVSNYGHGGFLNVEGDSSYQQFRLTIQ